MVPAGHAVFKMKVGVLPHQDELAHLEAMRGEFGETIDLRLDYNQALSRSAP